MAAGAPVAGGRPFRYQQRCGDAHHAGRNRSGAKDLGRVVQASRVTHNTGVALAGAGAVASAGIDSADVRAATRWAADAAEIAGGRANWVAAGGVGARPAWAIRLVEGLDPDDAADRIYRLVGTSVATQESVPAAFAVLAVYPDDPWQALPVRGVARRGLRRDRRRLSRWVSRACGPHEFTRSTNSRWRN
ncbi:MAG TPA: ADP-ribosylglycohydrolase family protein [Micromonosporaceae bacterium]